MNDEVSQNTGVSEMPLPGRPPSGGASSSNGAAGGRCAGAKRGRPVITVLEARPMNEVGFRDQSGGNRPKPEITVIGARPMSQIDGSGASGASRPHDHIYAEIPSDHDRPVHPQPQRRGMDILPPPDEEAPPTYHEAITETGADGGPPPPDLPTRPASITPSKSLPPPRPKNLPPPRPAAPPSRGSSAPTSPAEGTGAAEPSTRHGSTSSAGSGGEAAPVPSRPPPPGRGRPVARPRSMVAGAVAGPGASSVETNPEEFVPIKGKKPMGIAVFPLPSKPSVPVPAPREKPHPETEGSLRPAPTPRKPGPAPVRPGRMPMSVSMDAIPRNATTVEQVDNVENMDRAEQAENEVPPVRVLPQMPGSVSMDNIKNVSKETGGQSQPVVPTPRKRPTVVKPRPVSMPPSELELLAPSSDKTSNQGQPAEDSSSGELNKRLSGSAFALHIEEDEHAMVPRELRGSKPNLAPKPNKPPKPGVKPKPILPSKPKPPGVAAKPKLKQSRSSWYVETGESSNDVIKPKKGQRTTWYAASTAETENLMDLTSPKKPEPLPHGPTIIRRGANKAPVESNSPAEQTEKTEMNEADASQNPGATPFDSPEKTAVPPAEVKRPTIIKPLKAKTIKAITDESSLSKNTTSDSAEHSSSKLLPVQNNLSSNAKSHPTSGTEIKATTEITVDIPPDLNVSSDAKLESSPPATLPKPASPTSPGGVKPKGPPTAAKPSISPKSRTSHHEELSENIINEAKHNINTFSATSGNRPKDTEGSANNNQESQCDSCKTDGRHVPTKPKECLACKNDDDEFYDHTCEKASPRSPSRSPPKSPGRSPKLAAIGFEAIMGHIQTSTIPQEKTEVKRPIIVDTSSSKPISVQGDSPSKSNVSAEETIHSSQRQENKPATSSSDSQPSVASQNTPKPESGDHEQCDQQAFANVESSGQSSKVPPPLPSAPPVGSQWDLRQLQLNSPTRPDQPPTPTTPRSTPTTPRNTPERETTPDSKKDDSSISSAAPKKTPPGRPPPARPGPPRPSGPPRPAAPATSKKLYPSISTEVAAAEIEAEVTSTSPKSPPGRPASKPMKQETQPPLLPERPGPGHPLYHYVVSGPHGIALFDYNGDTPSDLSFKSGDVIELISWVDKEWMRGKVGEREGIFPVNFCDIVEPLPQETPTEVKMKMPSWDDEDDAPPVSSITGPRCVARFEFEGEGDNDLNFKEGDVISLKERDGEWLKGELRGKSGQFPLAFVEIIEDLPVETSPCNGAELADPSKEQNQPVIPTTQNKDEEAHCIAVHSYTSENPDDLTFNEGDRITLLLRLGPDWLKGKIGDKSGMFPANFVKIIKDVENPTETDKDRISSHNVPREPSRTPEALTTEPLTPSAPPGVPEFEVAAPAPDSAKSISVHPSGPSPTGGNNSTAPAPSARAMFDFDGETPEDISFKVGDKIELLGMIGDGSWLEGSLADGRTGMFPANFVSITHPLPDS